MPDCTFTKDGYWLGLRTVYTVLSLWRAHITHSALTRTMQTILDFFPFPAEVTACGFLPTAEVSPNAYICTATRAQIILEKNLNFYAAQQLLQ